MQANASAHADPTIGGRLEGSDTNWICGRAVSAVLVGTAYGHVNIVRAKAGEHILWLSGRRLAAALPPERSARPPDRRANGHLWAIAEGARDLRFLVEIVVGLE